MKPFIKQKKLNLIIDGQFGSTGKGLISAYVALNNHIDVFISNLSPNAGHTFNLGDGPKVVKQLPVGSVLRDNRRSLIYLTAGSIINPALLLKEIETFEVDPERLCIHPRAAIITNEDLQEERSSSSSVAKIASTQSGVGVALANKILRKAKLAKDIPELKEFIREVDLMWYMDQGLSVLMETSQGFDLGLNSGLAYPYCTSRDVTTSSCLSDAQVHPSYLGNVLMTTRTFPIRVGNLVVDGKTIGESGPFYQDSIETTWEDLKETPEFTTVTKRVRRVASFSLEQYKRSLHYIKPSHVFLNFVNYVKNEETVKLLKEAFKLKRPTHIGVGDKVMNIHEVHSLEEARNYLEIVQSENERKEYGLSKRY